MTIQTAECGNGRTIMDSGGRVIWITGLSGSGKTTLAQALQKELAGSVLLDGDSLRAVMGYNNKGFDFSSRKELAMIYARLACLLANQGETVIVATISLFHEVHAWNRAHQPGYLEVFLDIPADVREARDPKGLYAGKKKGAVANMAGSDVIAEFPLNPDVLINEKYSLDESVKEICKRI